MIPKMKSPPAITMHRMDKKRFWDIVSTGAIRKVQ